MEVRRSVEVGGMTTKEASEAHRVSYDAVRQRALREDWLTPAKIADKMAQKEREAQERALSQAVAKQVGDLPIEANKPHLPFTASSARLANFADNKGDTLLGLSKVLKNSINSPEAQSMVPENVSELVQLGTLALKLYNVGSEGVQVNVLVGGDGGFEGPTVSIEESELDDSELDD
jgi:hypothetical protein